MEFLTVNGGRKLFGNVRIPGAKNSVLPIMAASVLCRGAVTVSDVPLLSDVAACIDILTSIGCRVRMCENGVHIVPPEHPGCAVPNELMRTMRSSLFFLAPMLARTGRAEISMPGGCRLGARPIDLHLAGLARMGAQVQQTQSGTWLLCAPNGLHGAEIELKFPSVGATETLLMAACTAHGTTIVRNAAREPEVMDLAYFLRSAGADITGIGTREICIAGKEFLTGTQYAVCPDRITAATVLCAVAGCGGEVLMTNVHCGDLDAVIRLLRQAGCTIVPFGRDCAAAASDGRLRAVGSWKTGVHPAFPTDAAPLAAAALLRAQGESRVTDTVFENRFACAQGFRKMGAGVHVSERTLFVQGTGRLTGAEVSAPDLRGGAALVLAALQAQGESRIFCTQHISRGYENIAQLFASLGAQITIKQMSGQGS